MKIYRLFLLTILTGIAACSPLVDPDYIPPEDAITLRAIDSKGSTVTTIKGDGQSQARILAQLPAETTSQDVTFSTTGGHFVYNEGKTIKELSDSVSGAFRFARALLQSDSLKPSDPPKVLYITVEVAGTRQRLSLTLTK